LYVPFGRGLLCTISPPFHGVLVERCFFPTRVILVPRLPPIFVRWPPSPRPKCLSADFSTREFFRLVTSPISASAAVYPFRFFSGRSASRNNKSSSVNNFSRFVFSIPSLPLSVCSLLVVPNPFLPTFEEPFLRDTTPHPPVGWSKLPTCSPACYTFATHSPPSFSDFRTCPEFFELWRIP